MNNVVVSGRTIGDVDSRQINGSNGSFSTARVTISVRRPGARRDQRTGYYPSDLIELEAVGTTAEILSQVKKGERIIAVGYYRVDEYSGRDNQKRYAYKVRISSFERESANIPRNNSQNQQPMQQNNQNYNNGNNAIPQQNMSQPMQQTMNQPASQPAVPQMQNNVAPQQQTMQQTIPNGTYDIPQGMPQGQGMPDFSNLEGMPNFENLPFV